MKYSKSTKIITIIVVVIFLLATFLGGIVPFLMPAQEEPATTQEITTSDIEKFDDVDMIVNPAEQERLDIATPEVEAEVVSPVTQ